MTDPEAYRRAFDEEVKNITAQFMTPSASTTTGVDISSINPVAVQRPPS
jgi:hypothetical protein